MKLTIVAATGGIGRCLLDQALAAGHDVTVVVRRPDRLTVPVRAVEADLTAADPAALEAAVAGADAVLSGLGPRSRADAGIAADVRRIVAVSAAPLGTVASPGRPSPPRHDPGDGFFMRHLFSRIARAAFAEHYADLALTEDMLRDSGLDWTVVRPPRLSDKPLTGRYRTAHGRNLRGGWIVPRADVAHLMLRCVDHPDTVGQFIGVAT
jgi:uncharacterized protein YbjT (DUF2867 family)